MKSREPIPKPIDLSGGPLTPWVRLQHSLWLESRKRLAEIEAAEQKKWRITSHISPVTMRMIDKAVQAYVESVLPLGLEQGSEDELTNLFGRVGLLEAIEARLVLLGYRDSILGEGRRGDVASLRTTLTGSPRTEFQRFARKKILARLANRRSKSPPPRGP
jgi:hypothetical protein